MERSSEYPRQERLYARLIGVGVPLLFGACLAVASFLPDKRLWGVNHLAFYDPLVRFIAFLVIASCFVPQIRQTVYRKISTLATYRPGPQHVALAVASTVFPLILFLLFPSSTLLLGDGQYIASNLETVASAESDAFFAYLKHPDHIYPGTDLLYVTAARAVGKVFGGSPLAGVRILVALLGAMLVFVLIMRLARSFKSSEAAGALLFSVVLVSGGIQLFFGYIEVYAPLALVVVLYVIAARRTISGAASLWAPVLLAALGVFLHLLALILIPSLCFLVLWVAFGRRTSARMLGSCLILTAVTMAFPIVAMQIDGLRKSFLPLVGDAGGYRVLSAAHLIDIANELLLVFPGLVVLVPMAIATTRFGRRDTLTDEVPGSHVTPMRRSHPAFRPDFLFSMFLLLPGILFLLLFKPELGMARDWDLFVMTGVGFYVAMFTIFANYRADLLTRRTMELAAAPLLAMTLVLTAAWVGINANVARSVARYESILSYDTTNAGYAYENLATHFHDRGDITSEIRALEQAVSTSPNPRYGFLLGLRYYHVGQEEMAVSALRKCLKSDPNYDRARQFLAQMLFFGEEFEETLAVCGEGARLKPDEALYPFLTGKVYLAKGNVAEALVAFDTCRTLTMPVEMARELDELLRRLQQAK